jgi:alpha-L-fucosidase
MFGEGKVKFASGDVRYMVKDGALFAAFLVQPDGPVSLKAIPRDATIERVTLVGGGKVKFEKGEAGLTLTLKSEKQAVVPVVRIDGRGIV